MREGGRGNGTYEEPRPFTLLGVTGALQTEPPPYGGVRDLGGGQCEREREDEEERADGPGRSTCR